jgi:cholesterol oxidase
MSKPDHFDAVVVGSGFGGSVTAHRLREGGKSVCLLERGKSWAPGEFPRSPREVAVNFWDPSDGLYGFFDIWSFKGIEALISSCLGGGSIIYANVLLRKDEEWFVHEDGEYWPVSRADLEPHYDNVEAVIKPQQYPFDVEPYASTPKTRAMRDAAAAHGLDWRLPPLAVTFANPGQPPVPNMPMEDGENLHGARRFTCELLGECNAGCNLGAKNTLDLNYLSLFAAAGGEIRTLAEVKAFRPREGGGFSVDYVRHDPDAGSQTPVTITSDRLVLSAGSLGSTFLLLRNRDAFPAIGDALGTHWCGNGDLLGFLAKSKRPLDPERGAVITSAIRYEGEDGRGYYIEDGGYPGFVSWLMEGTNAPGVAVRAAEFVARRVADVVRHRPVSNLSGEFGALMGDGSTSSGTLPLLGMGRDVPDGRLYLEGGFLENTWSVDSSQAYYDSVKASMEQLAESLDAQFRDEPLWYFKRVITVHPVGGCPMGRSSTDGVVDSYGQVFGHPGLSIADGSVLPGPVGPNPSLTIAACADRAADWMLENWESGAQP